jgi:hypothetical protein
MTIGDAVNLAILEEMIRDPTTVIHAEDLQAGSSYNIPKLTQQTFGTLRAADEIIDEGHFIGKALGEGMNGYRPIVELMNANFGICKNKFNSKRVVSNLIELSIRKTLQPELFNTRTIEIRCRGPMHKLQQPLAFMTTSSSRSRIFKISV